MNTYTETEALDDPEFLFMGRAGHSRCRNAVQNRAVLCREDRQLVWAELGWFSGKGLLAWRKQKLTLPPFVPSRVVSQHRFLSEGARPGPQQRLHVWQPSAENLHRYADIVVHEASVFWYSGGTKENNRASFMAYVLTPEGHWPWYIGLRKKETWEVVEALGISRGELDLIHESEG